MGFDRLSQGFLRNLGRAQSALALALFASGVGLEAALMIHRALWLKGLGPICGLHPATLHCPGCYAAMALAAAGAVVAALPPAKRLQRQKI